jgi:DNA-binding response OmpR family regulator
MQSKQKKVLIVDDEADIRENALKAGADGFISKPFNIDELLSMLVQYG